MLRFMLDTDICSYILKRSNDIVLLRLRRVPIDEVCISVITKAELLLGVELSPRRGQDAVAVAEFLRQLVVLDLPEGAAAHYAEIGAGVSRRGEMIGANDLFIAAHARCLGLRLVTNNIREFARIPQLSLENWAAPDG